VLLVSTRVLEEMNKTDTPIESCIKSGVVALPFDYKKLTSYDELGGIVNAYMSTRKDASLQSVGLMFHSKPDVLQCFEADPPKSTKLVDGVRPADFEPFCAFVIKLKEDYGIKDLDIISCNVVRDKKRNALVDLDFGGVKVNTSTNNTGNTDPDGNSADWVLEMGDVDLSKRYFTEKILGTNLVLNTELREIRNGHVNFTPKPNLTCGPHGTSPSGYSGSFSPATDRWVILGDVCAMRCNRGAHDVNLPHYYGPYNFESRMGTEYHNVVKHAPRKFHNHMNKYFPKGPKTNVLILREKDWPTDE